VPTDLSSYDLATRSCPLIYGTRLEHRLMNHGLSAFHLERGGPCAGELASARIEPRDCRIGALPGAGRTRRALSAILGRWAEMVIIRE
jgi:hypothetical protein